MLKVSKYEVFSGRYVPVFGLNTGKYGPEKTPYLDTFHAVLFIITSKMIGKSVMMTENSIKSNRKCLKTKNQNVLESSHT